MSSPPPFVSGTLPKQVSFTREFVQPPSAQYVTPEDKLFIVSKTNKSEHNVAIRARLLTPTGEIQRLDFNHTTQFQARANGFEAFTITEGFLLDVGVFNLDGEIFRGELYVQIGLLRGTIDQNSFTTTLAQGYIEGLGGIFWPGGPIESSLAGEGHRIVIVGTEPAVGEEILEVVPSNAVWKVHGVHLRLDLGGGTDNRRPYLQFLDDGPDVIMEAAAFAQKNGNQIFDYDWAPGSRGSTLNPNRLVQPIPSGVVLREDFRIQTSTQNIQGSDQWAPPLIYIEEFLED